MTAQLEIRVSGAGRVLRGAFPLGRTATINSAGRVRKERFASGGGGRSVSWQIREFEKLQSELSQVITSTLDDAAKTLKVEALEDAIEKRNTHLLVGHSYDRAIADTKTGNLTLAFSDDAVRFEAALPDEVDHAKLGPGRRAGRSEEASCAGFHQDFRSHPRARSV